MVRNVLQGKDGAMVCRENKGRSFVMGLTKYFARERGLGYLGDHAYQSAVHELNHEWAKGREWTIDEQIALWKALRQSVVDHPGISDAMKFRPATGRGGQTGLVTRADQEIARLEALKANPMISRRKEEMNTGAQMQAIMRIGSMLDRQLPAQREYAIVYARHTGTSVEKVEAKLRALCESDESARKYGSVADDEWNKGLRVAGLSPQAQADLAQSGRTRYAIAQMERERLEAIESLESRPTIRAGMTTRFLSPAEANAVQQCTGPGACGQFGHTSNACPNTSSVAELSSVRRELQSLQGSDTTDEQRAAARALRAREAELAKDINAGSAGAPEAPAIYCTACKMYGHTDGDCPNTAAVAAWHERQEQARAHARAALYAYTRAALNTPADQRNEQQQQQVETVLARVPEEEARRIIDVNLSRYEAAHGPVEDTAQALAAANDAERQAASREDLEKELVAANPVTSTQNTLKCEACGQFGHDEPSCPNKGRLERIDDLNADLADMWKARELASIRDLTSRDNVMISSDRGMLRGTQAAAYLEAQSDKPEHTRVPATESQKAILDRQIAQKEEEIQSLRNEMDEAAEQARTRVSRVVQSIGYNPNTGTMLVTMQPRYIKSRAQWESPQYIYHVDRATARRILNPRPEDGVEDSLGARVNATLFQRAENGFHYDAEKGITTESDVALTERRCPTCQRFAPMNGAHRCPVPGAGDSDPYAASTSVSAVERRMQREQKRRAIKDGAWDYPDQPRPSAVAMPNRFVALPGQGSIALPEPKQVTPAADAGKVVTVTSTMKGLDGTVTGAMRVWTDPSGTRIASLYPSVDQSASGGPRVPGMRCSCPQYRQNGSCAHIDRFKRIAADRYGVAFAPEQGFEPTNTVAAWRAQEAEDVPRKPSRQRGYSDIMAMRRELESGEIEEWNSMRRKGGPVGPPRLVPPRDPGTGQALQEWPETWERHVPDELDGSVDPRLEKSEPVDLNDTSAVVARIRKGLYSQTREHYSVSKNADGSITITVPPARRLKDGSVPQREREKLAQALGVPTTRVDGVHVPADTSWRKAMLDRAYGDPPSVIPASHAFTTDS